jgi:hypothetical protein
VDNDGFDDAVAVRDGASHALYRGATILPTACAMTWTAATTESAAGGFDIDRDRFADFFVGTTANAPVLYRGSATGSILVTGALSALTGSNTVAFSDHDGDGRPDFIGANGATNGAAILWAGSNGTTDPRALQVRLPTEATFSGRLVR